MHFSFLALILGWICAVAESAPVHPVDFQVMPHTSENTLNQPFTVLSQVYEQKNSTAPVSKKKKRGESSQKKDKDMIDCENINQDRSFALEVEEQIVCSLCNATKGIRINGNNWLTKIQMSKPEKLTFNAQNQKLQSKFMDVPFAFAIGTASMCFVTRRPRGMVDVLQITDILSSGGQKVDNKAFFSVDKHNGYPAQTIFPEKIEPDLIAARYTLHPEERTVVKSEYFLKGQLENTVHANIFHKTLRLEFYEETLDSFMQAATFYGTASFQHGNETLTIPFYYQQFLDDFQQDHLLTLNPFKDTFEVSTFIELFEIKEQLEKFPMPKGISSFFPLPVTNCQMFLDATKRRPKRVSISFKSPPFFFMPKIMFQGVTGDLQIDFLSNERQEINVFLNGYSYINGVKFYATVEKMQFQPLYTAYLKSTEGELSFQFVEEDIFNTFNVGMQDFWPENDQKTTNIVKEKLKLSSKILNLPQVEIYWLPRLIQVIKGKISIFPEIVLGHPFQKTLPDGSFGEISQNTTTALQQKQKEEQKPQDAEISVLLANLAGSTLTSTHITWKKTKDNVAKEAFFRVFDLQEPVEINEFHAFDITRFQLMFTNQDVDLDNWENLKNLNQFADEQLWVQGCTVKLNLKLRTNCTEEFCQIFSSVFTQLTSITHRQELTLTGHFPLEDSPLRLTSILAPIQLSNKVELKESKLVLEVRENKIEMWIEGHMIVEVSQDEHPLKFLTTIDAKDKKWINLEGKLKGIQKSVFGIRDLQMSMVQINGQIDTDAQLHNSSISGLGLFGQECFGLKGSQDPLAVNELLSQIERGANGPNFGLAPETDSHTVRLIEEIQKSPSKNLAHNAATNDTKCFTGDIKLSLIESQEMEATFQGHVWVRSFKSLLYFLLASPAQFSAVYSSVISPIASLQFGHGIDMTYNKKERLYIFDGTVNFLGLNAYSMIKYKQDERSLWFEFELPSFTIGKDNIQVITIQDFYMPLSQEEEKRIMKTPSRVVVDLQLNKSIRPDFDQLSIECNVKVLEYLTKARLIMDNEQLTFTTDDKARPFNGIFEAQISVFIMTQEGHLPNATALVNATFNDYTEEYKKLENRANEILTQWFEKAREMVSHYYGRTAKLMAYIETLRGDLCEPESCSEYIQCQDRPRFMCLDYHTLPKCAKKEKQCAKYQQVCTKKVSNVCLDSTFKLNLEDEEDKCPWETEICAEWEYQCQDSEDRNGNTFREENEFCTEHYFDKDYDYCSLFQLDCKREYVYDQFCKTVCQDKNAEFNNLHLLNEGFLTIADAASDLYSKLISMAEAQESTPENLIQFASLQINSELYDTYQKEDYNVTIMYLMQNMMNSPRIVSTNRFDFDHFEVAAQHIAQAIRYDICELYNISYTLADYLDISIKNFQSLASTVKKDMHIPLVKEEMLKIVMQKTQEEVKAIDDIKANEKQRIMTIRKKEMFSVEQKTKRIAVRESTASAATENLPSGLDSIFYHMLERPNVARRDQ